MKKGVAIIEGLTILFLMQFLGELLSRAFNLVLPGNLVGLLLLFLCLITGIIKVRQVEEATDLLLNNMMLLFIPLNVGLMTIFPLLKRDWLAIITSLLLSTVLVMLITGKVVELINKRKGDSSEPVGKTN